MEKNKKEELYSKVSKKISKNAKQPIVLHIRRYKLFSLLINLGAVLKGREPWSHTAFLYFENGHPWVYDMTASKDAAIKPLFHSYFSGDFWGKVEAHVIPDEMISPVNIQMFNWGKQYSALKAIKAWFSWLPFISNRDSFSKAYCTDEVLDIIERLTGKQYIVNNAKSTPASFYAYAQKRKFKKIDIIDTRFTK